MNSDQRPAPLQDEYSAQLELRSKEYADQVEVLEQALFERERYAASIARALSEAHAEANRRAVENAANQAATLASAEHRVAQAEAEKNRVIADLKNSTSWKVSLPVRALRHPVRYLKIALKR